MELISKVDMYNDGFAAGQKDAATELAALRTRVAELGKECEDRLNMAEAIAQESYAIERQRDEALALVEQAEQRWEDAQKALDVTCRERDAAAGEVVRLRETLKRIHRLLSPEPMRTHLD